MRPKAKKYQQLVKNLYAKKAYSHTDETPTKATDNFSDAIVCLFL